MNKERARMELVFKIILVASCVCLSSAVYVNIPPPFLGSTPFDAHKSKESKKLKLHTYDFNKSYKNAFQQVERLLRLENQLSNVYEQNNDISYGHYLEAIPEDQAVDQQKDAYLSGKMAIHLIGSHCPYTQRYSFRDCAKLISRYSLNSSDFGPTCSKYAKKCSHEELNSKYRSMDGSCNHKDHGTLGKSFTAYKRLLSAAYVDGISSIRRSVTKKELPSARSVSLATAKDHDRVNKKLTQAVMQWSEFIANDLAHTPVSKTVYTNDQIECCDGFGWPLAPRHQHPFCLPIKVDDNDLFYEDHFVRCMTYVRSSLAVSPDCKLGSYDQLNQATHFLDGSQVYGNTLEKANSLRKLKGGLLNYKESRGRLFLPDAENPKKECLFGDRKNCFKSGDTRVNSHPQLTAMHTIWMREHNRIIKELSKHIPHWSDETLFQEARRIVVAEMQHITYNEWLPLVVGDEYAKFILHAHVVEELVDPTVSNSFATAASRFMKSLVDNKVNFYTEDRNVHSEYRLGDNYNNPNILEHPDHLDFIVRGLATQNIQDNDIHYANDVTTQFHGNGEFGLDSLSLDIQRGRDHGLPSYTEYRNLCGLGDVDSFQDFLDVMPEDNMKALASVYQDPKDVDLIVGAMSEKPREGALLGPTFTCLIVDQMLRTRLGDRFFYMNRQQPVPFTEQQLAEIKKVTLAKIFCENGDEIKKMQPNVFKAISPSNTLTNCDELPELNLTLFTGFYNF